LASVIGLNILFFKEFSEKVDSLPKNEVHFLPLMLKVLPLGDIMETEQLGKKQVSGLQKGQVSTRSEELLPLLPPDQANPLRFKSFSVMLI